VVKQRHATQETAQETSERRAQAARTTLYRFARRSDRAEQTLRRHATDCCQLERARLSGRILSCFQGSAGGQRGGAAAGAVPAIRTERIKADADGLKNLCDLRGNVSPFFCFCVATLLPSGGESAKLSHRRDFRFRLGAGLAGVPGSDHLWAVR